MHSASGHPCLGSDAQTGGPTGRLPRSAVRTSDSGS